MKKSDHFPLRVSRGIATSDEYAELTDRERAVFWTAAALSFEPLTFKRLARTMGSKIEAAVGRLVEQGFLEVDGEVIKLAARWIKVDMSTERVNACRARKKAAKAVEASAAPTPHPVADRAPQATQIAPQLAAQPTPTVQPEPAPIQATESRIPTFPPAENFEDAIPYAEDWGSEEFGIDLKGLAASPAFNHTPAAAPSPVEKAAAIVEVAPAASLAPSQSKAARKRAAAEAEADEIANIDLPDYLPRESWLEFMKHRRVIKNPMNLDAAKKLLTRAAELHAGGWSVVASIDAAIVSGKWVSINPTKTITEQLKEKAATPSKFNVPEGFVLDAWGKPKKRSAGPAL